MRRAGDVSDDTQLAIAVARSVDPTGEYLPRALRRRVRQWSSYRVAAGRATSRAARRLLRGTASQRRLQRGKWWLQRSVSRRSRSRIAAICDEQALLEDVALNTAVTHQSHAAEAGARLVALLVWRALRAPAGAVADQVAVSRWVVESARRAGFSLERYYAAHKTGGNLEAQLAVCGTRAHCLESVSAVLVALVGCRGDLSRGMTAVLAAGGDTDSIAAMLGAVLGASLGTRGIPHELYSRVQHRRTLIDLADRLAGRRTRPAAHISGRLRSRSTTTSRSATSMPWSTHGTGTGSLPGCWFRRA